jgi:hypothetical protein
MMQLWIPETAAQVKIESNIEAKLKAVHQVSGSSAEFQAL